MNITLRAGEKIYINGAVLRVDRKVIIELMNDATFLLENHVMQADEATTPLRQIYFVVQVMLMDPSSAKSSSQVAFSLIKKSIEVFDNTEIIDGLKNVFELIEKSRYFESLKLIRGLYYIEKNCFFSDNFKKSSTAA